MKRVAMCLVLAGCTTVEPVEVRNIYLYPDSATADVASDASEASTQDAPGSDDDAQLTTDATIENVETPEPSTEAGPEATIDSPYQDSASDVALDGTVADACAPIYTITDSASGTADGGDLSLTVLLECAPGEHTPTGQGVWLGKCELDGSFVTGCSCTHVGVSGVRCGATTKGTGTLTLTIWCERSCDPVVDAAEEPCACVHASYPYVVEGVGGPGGIVAKCPDGAKLDDVEKGWCDCSQAAFPLPDGWGCYPPAGQPCGTHIRCSGPYCMATAKPCE